MSNQNVLVMGGGGFLGTHLCNQLVVSGYKVRAFGRSKSELLHSDVEFIRGHFENINEVRTALKGQDCVYHMIHGTSPPSVNNDIEGDIRRSINPTLSLLSQCLEYRLKKIIFISSGGTVYGNNGMVASKESDPTMPISAYGAHKLLIENYLRIFLATKQLDYLIFRLSNPYGPLQSTKQGIGLIRVVIDSIKNNRSVDIYGDGETLRDYIYVDDAIRAMEAAISYKGSHKIFNIGSGEGKSINEIIFLLEQIMNLKSNKNTLLERNFDVRRSILDISLAKKELNWSPNTDLMSGINLTLNSL